MTGTLGYSSNDGAIVSRSRDAGWSGAAATLGRGRAPVTPKARPHPSMWKQPGASVPYIPGLDGLRAIAVVAVLLFHAEVPGVRGGFLGVDVFFVISGYLITAILMTQWRNRRWIDLKAFYLRRARRLLPALFVVLFGVSLISVIFLRSEVATLRGDVIASLTYVTNWFFVLGQKSYFEASGRESLVKHLWSLAVEEQYYLLWPVLFAFGMRKLGQRWLLAAVLAGAAASSLLMAALYHSGEDSSRVWYGTDTRAAALLIGSGLAMVWAPYRLRGSVGRFAPFILDLLGFAALATLLLMLSLTDQFATSLYRGGFAKVAIVTAILISVVAHPAARIGRLLGIAPLRWLGLRSYGIYLFHWPVFMLTRPNLDVAITGYPLLAIRLAITLGLATVSYRFVETPIREGLFRRGLERWRAAEVRPRRWMTLGWSSAGVIGVTAIAVLSFALARAEPPPTPEFLLAGSTTSGLPPGRLPPGRLPPVRLPPVRLPVQSNDPSPGHFFPSGTIPFASDTTSSTDPGTETSGMAETALAALSGASGTSIPTAPNGTSDPVPSVAPETTVPPDTTVAPETTVPPAAARHFTAIGDSVMLGAAPALQSNLPGSVFVDARVGRQVSECLSILHEWHDKGLLGDVVVVHIGNNGTFGEDQFNEMRDILSGVPKVIFLTNKVPRMWEEPNNQVIRDGAAKMPNAVLIDWKAEGDAHPEFFYNDGMHLRPDGAQYYSGLIKARL